VWSIFRLQVIEILLVDRCDDNSFSVVSCRKFNIKCLFEQPLKYVFHIYSILNISTGLWIHDVESLVYSTQCSLYSIRNSIGFKIDSVCVWSNVMPLSRCSYGNKKFSCAHINFHFVFETMQSEEKRCTSNLIHCFNGKTREHDKGKQGIKERKKWVNDEYLN
jgi:hypothetical protein